MKFLCQANAIKSCQVVSNVRMGWKLSLWPSSGMDVVNGASVGGFCRYGWFCCGVRWVDVWLSPVCTYCLFPQKSTGFCETVCIYKYNQQWHCNQSYMMETVRATATLEIHSILAHYLPKKISLNQKDVTSFHIADNHSPRSDRHQFPEQFGMPYPIARLQSKSA